MLKKVQPVPLAEVAAYLAPFAAHFKRAVKDERVWSAT